MAIAWTCLVIFTLVDQVGRSTDRWYLPALLVSLSVTTLAAVVTHNAGATTGRLIAMAATAAVITTTVWAGGTAALRASDACLVRGSLATPYQLDIGFDPWQGGVSCQFVPERGEPTRVLIPLHELVGTQRSG